MRAAVLTDYGKPLSLESVSVPEPLAGEVLLEVLACGVCHSDLHIADGDLPGFRALTKHRVIPGHEVVGRVVRCGPSVTSLHVGDRIGVPWLYRACGSCEQCHEGFENLCRQDAAVTGMTVDGGYAQFMCANANYAVRIPEPLRDEEAAPLLCAGVTSYRALRKAGVVAGQRVAVFGIGGLGHLAVQLARAMRAQVFALDVSEEKLDLARELGAEHVLNVADPSALKLLRDHGGMHAAVVTSAAQAAYSAALKCLRPNATLCVVGLPSEPLQFQALALVGAEAHIVGSAVGTREDLRAVLDLAAQGQLRCRVEVQPLSRINDVMSAMRRGTIQGRVVVNPRS
ncbi:MAG TPA: zinc-dependent alcohol dehydrogenase [Burkholderiaceae bacterium]|nr:zinc-dependent alcohol dehydrogenase [Burkholderiaceae bacterium]